MNEKNEEVKKISVAEATRKILGSHPSIMDALRLGIINYTSLAECIKSEVEACLEREVKTDAIKISIIRFADEIKETFDILEKKVSKIISDSVLELKNDLSIVVARCEAFLSVLPRFMSVINKARFIQITQGTETFTIVIDLKFMKALVNMLGDENIVSITENQSAIILISPPEIITTPGVVAYITYLLASNGVNITQIISCHTDTILIVNRENALRAYSILEKQILLLRSFDKST